jgi:transcriptional regulator
MYLPKYFAPKNQQKIRELISRNSFAVLISFPKESTPLISHLPVIFSSKPGEENILIGHMAKANFHWKYFKKNPDGMIIINGEHTYITPRWYSSPSVPTWNYAVAHLYGKIELIEGFAKQVQILKELASFFEKSSPSPWKFNLPEGLDKENVLTASIISFKFHIEKIDAKFKLSQNRDKTDRAGVLDGLQKERADDMSAAVRKLMLENIPDDSN